MHHLWLFGLAASLETNKLSIPLMCVPMPRTCKGRAHLNYQCEVSDASNGTLLDTVNLSAFQTGIYHSYDVKGSVRFRFTRTGPLNVITSAVFIDPASAPL